MLKPEDLIGIINFQNNAKVVVPLTHKDPSAQDRILKLAIPTTFNNKTSNIWNGIYIALTKNCSHIHKYTWVHKFKVYKKKIFLNRICKISFNDF